MHEVADSDEIFRADEDEKLADIIMPGVLLPMGSSGMLPGKSKHTLAELQSLSLLQVYSFSTSSYFDLTLVCFGLHLTSSWPALPDYKT